MPILWRYLLSQYIRVLILCIAAFLAVLVTTRLDEIAHFAALGPKNGHLLGFFLFQIPYILPIAFPISGLISSYLLFNRLSQTYELVALRATGFTPLTLITPIIICSAFFSLASFVITSDIATYSHRNANEWKSELRSLNPLLLLHNQHLRKLNGIYFDTLGSSKLGELAEDTIIAMKSQNKKRTHLFIAKKMKVHNPDFIIQNGTYITPMLQKDDASESYLIENYDELKTNVDDFSLLFQDKKVKVKPDYFQFSELLSKIRDFQHLKKKEKFELFRFYSEIFRRIALAISIIPFTLMGASFGISISRNRSAFKLFIVLLLSAFVLVGYLVAQSLDHQPILSAFFYFVPLIMVTLFSLKNLNRINSGIE